MRPASLSLALFTVAGLLTGLPTSAHSAPFERTLDLTCRLSDLGDQPVSLTLSGSLPNTVTDEVSEIPIELTSQFQFTNDVYGFARFLEWDTVSGTIQVGVAAHDGLEMVATRLEIPIPPTPLDTSMPPLRVSVAATNAMVAIPSGGAATDILIDDIDLTIVSPLQTFQFPCDLTDHPEPLGQITLSSPHPPEGRFEFISTLDLPRFMGDLPLVGTAEFSNNDSSRQTSLALDLQTQTVAIDAFFGVLPLYATFEFEPASLTRDRDSDGFQATGSMGVKVREIGLNAFGSQFALFNSEQCALPLDLTFKAEQSNASTLTEGVLTASWNSATQCKGLEATLTFLFTNQLETASVSLENIHSPE